MNTLLMKEKKEEDLCHFLCYCIPQKIKLNIT